MICLPAMNLLQKRDVGLFIVGYVTVCTNIIQEGVCVCVRKPVCACDGVHLYDCV